jgi:AmiR/NasT family two-component response regulator
MKETTDALTLTVQRLGGELTGLRRAQRSCAVVEQAKGVLMGRLHCTAEQAFGQLTQISQQTNTKVVEVAAGLLGLTSPVVSEYETLAPIPPSRTAHDRSAGRYLALPDQEAARYHLTCAAMSAARDGNEIAAALLRDGLLQLGATGVLLAVIEPDRTIRLAGSYGLPRVLVSAWQRVPGDLHVGFLKAAAEGRSLWLRRTEAETSGLELLGEGEFRACLPLRHGHEIFGVALIVWAGDADLDPARRAYVSALAAAAGRRLTQLASDDVDTVASPAAHWLDAVLEALPGSFALLCPITDDWGTVVDWRFDRISSDASDAAGRTGEQLTGRRLLELYPYLADSAILRGYERALRTGRPFSGEELLPGGQGGFTAVTVRAARLGDGILLTWRHDDSERRLLERIDRVQRATAAGWAEWDLQTGDTEWAAETRGILGPRNSPLELADFPGCVVTEDVPVAARAVQEVLRGHRMADVIVRIDRRGTPTWVRVLIEPVLDARDRLVAVCGAVHTVGPFDRPPAGWLRNGDGTAPRLTTAPPAAEPRSDEAASSSPVMSHLAATVRRLRAEVDDLRRMQQVQAVVEQARGMLAVQLGCSVAEAAEHLVRTSRQRRIPVVDLAAEIVGVAVPALPIGETTGDPAFSPERYVGRPPAAVTDAEETAAPVSSAARERLTRVRTAMDIAEDGDALARILWAEGLRDLGATAVLLGVLEPDGAVRLVGTHGLPDPLVNAWRRTPGSVNVAYLRAVATDTPLWITRAEAEEKGYQLLAEGELRACLPLHHAGHTFGVASVLWEKAADPDPEARAYVAALADACSGPLSRLVRSGRAGTAVASPAAHWADTIVAALPASYALLRPVRGAGGDVVDWRFESCSPETTDLAGRNPAEIVGRRFGDLYPQAVGSGLLDTYSKALETGATAVWGPREIDILTQSGPLTATISVRASRFGDGVLVHWYRQDPHRRLAKRLDLLERVAGCGWAEWYLTTGHALWSAAVYDILQRDPAKGPVRLGALHRYVAPEDEAVMAEAVHAVTHRRQAVDFRVSLRRHGRTSPVRFVAEPVLDRQGRLVAVHAVVQRLPAR